MMAAESIEGKAGRLLHGRQKYTEKQAAESVQDKTGQLHLDTIQHS